MPAGVYCLRFTENAKVYIGSSKDLIAREYTHFWGLKNNKHPNRLLQRAANKYGVDNIVFQLLETNVPVECLTSREQYWIDKYNSSNPNKGYNLKPLASSMLGYKHTKETKIKISASIVGKPKIMCKKRTSSWNKGLPAWNRGLKHSKETITKISERAKTRPLMNEETKQKISAALKQRSYKKPILFDKVIELHEAGYTYDSILSITGISRTTACRWVRKKTWRETTKTN